MSLQVRAAEKGDTHEIIFMMNKFQEHMERCNPNVWKITEYGRNEIESIVDEMLSGLRKTFIAEKDGVVVGFSHCHVERRMNYTPGTIGYFDMLYVKQKYRRMGIASNLIHAVCNYFTYEHVVEVNLRYVIGNSEAEALWKSLGLSPVLITANVNLEVCKQKLSVKQKSFTVL